MRQYQYKNNKFLPSIAQENIIMWKEQKFNGQILNCIPKLKLSMHKYCKPATKKACESAINSLICRLLLRSGRDSNSRAAFGDYTLSRQLSPIVNDWLIISCLKAVPACAYVARKIYAAKLIIFFDVAITFAPFLSFFFLSVRDSIGC